MATIQGIYLALFGRPADPAGLAYYNGVTSNGADLSGIGNLAGQKEYLDRFSGMNSAQIVQSIYQSLFGRAGEQAGIDFWVGRLTSGALTINNIAIAILDGATGTDKQRVDAKIAAADLFTSHLDLPAERSAYNAAALASVRDYFAAVDATHIASAAEIDALILKISTGAGQAPAGGADAGGGSPPGVVQPVSLTVLDADHVSPSSPDLHTRTTSADDKITVSDTYHAVGTIDGGAGFDTLVIATTGAVTPTSSSIQNVERLDINPTGPGNIVDVHDVQGLKEISLIGSDAEVIGIGKDVTTIHLMGQIGGFTTFSLADPSGLDDTITLKPDNFHTITFRNVSLNLPGFEHIIIDADSESSIKALSDTDLKTMVIAGKNDVAVELYAGSQALVIDTSGHTGNTAVSVADRGFDTSLKFIGSAGSDIFTAVGGNLSMAGGNGADVFNVKWTTDGNGQSDMDVITDFDPAKDTLVLSVDTKTIVYESSLTPVRQAKIATADTLLDALGSVASEGFNQHDPDGSWAIEFVYRDDTYVYSENGNAHHSLIKLTGVSGPIDPQHMIIHSL